MTVHELHDKVTAAGVKGYMTFSRGRVEVHVQDDPKINVHALAVKVAAAADFENGCFISAGKDGGWVIEAKPVGNVGRY